MAESQGNVLELMAASIVQRKAEKATKLTPVAGEQAVTPASAIPGDVPGVFLAKEALADIAADLRRQADILIGVADGLDVVVGVPAAVERDSKAKAETEQKLVEREKDRRAADREKAAAGDKRAAKRVEEESPMKAIAEQIIEQDKAAAQVLVEAAAGAVTPEEFSERLQRLSSEAQAATFKAKADDTESEDPPESGVWLCPTHKVPASREKTSPRGRHYLACPSCDEFERV